MCYTKKVKNKSKKFDKAFTLIELLVVVAIIGILSAIVIASLNIARNNGKVSMIKSTLKNIQSQSEITYLETGSYASLYNTTTYDCIGSLSAMAQSLSDQGVVVKCYSRNNLVQSDVYLRFGATAIIYDANLLKAWSVDRNGVVAWDQQGVNSSGVYVNPDTYTGMTHSVSTQACASAGGRLPSVEQLFTLARAYYSASGNTTYKPTSSGFVADHYRSATTVPSDSSQSYGVRFSDGVIFTGSVLTPYYVRCVR